MSTVTSAPAAPAARTRSLAPIVGAFGLLVLVALRQNLRRNRSPRPSIGAVGPAVGDAAVERSISTVVSARVASVSMPTRSVSMPVASVSVPAASVSVPPALRLVPTASVTRARSLAPIACAFSLVVLVEMMVLAVFNHYTLRIISDTPTYMALVEGLAKHPMTPDSVFFGTTNTYSAHATPYIQALALIWKLVAPGGHLGNPVAVGTFLAIVAIPVSLFTLGMVWLYVRTIAGREAAFFSVPAVLAAFGPAHIISAGDLSLNGLLGGGFYPTTFAAGATLALLLSLRGRSLWASALSVVLTWLVLTSDLFAGLVMIVVVIITACLRGVEDPREARRIATVLLIAALLTSAWPLTDVFGGFSAVGVQLPVVLVAAYVAPVVWRVLALRLPSFRLVARLGRPLTAPISGSLEERTAWLGLVFCLLLLAYSIYEIVHWPSNPLIHSYRLGFYWSDQRYRWLLLLLPGFAGLVGLVRLARRGAGELSLWLLVLFVAGAAGSALFIVTGKQLPLYYRFSLACQLPVAIGVAALLGHHKRRRTAQLVGATLAISFAFKVVSLLVVSLNTNYFGAPLQTAWSFDRVIPPHSGTVASDPGTSYYIPAATQNLVVTLSGHADSGSEPALADDRYKLMHLMYTGNPHDVAWAMQSLWNKLDVRTFVVEKFTTFAPPLRSDLFISPYSSLIQRRDMPLMARYLSYLTMTGTQVYNDDEYSIFRINRQRMLRALSGVPSMRSVQAPQTAEILRSLVAREGQGAAAAARQLYRMGVRLVTLSYGALGSQPRIYAFGEGFTPPDEVTVNLQEPGLRCATLCYYNRASWMDKLGRVVHQDLRFVTIVRLSAPKAR